MTYAGVPSSYIDLTAWAAEVTNFIDRVYTALIAEPTPVETLISELCEQSALALWWDDLTEAIRLQAIRAIATTAFTFDDRNRARVASSTLPLSMTMTSTRL